MERYANWRHILISWLLGLLLTGCAVSGASGIEITSDQFNLDEIPMSHAEQTPTGETYGQSPVDYLTSVAIQDLADRVGIDARWITIESAAPRQFPDSSLGLPQPDHVYAQVITPGYIIHLKADGRLYRYHGSERRVVYGGLVSESANETPDAHQTQDESQADLTMITLYFTQKARMSSDTDELVATERIVEPDDVTPSVALELLFRGPTESEREKGISSCFSGQTQGLYRGVRIQNGTAYVDLKDPRQLLSELTSKEGLAQFDAQVLRTLQNMADVERVIYAIEGDPVPFYQWLGMGCGPNNDFCDAAPFRPTPVPLTQASPTPPSDHVTGIDVNLALGDGAVVLRQTSADLDGDGHEELIVVSDVGLGQADSVGNRIELSIIQPELADPPVAWKVRTRGLDAGPLELMDLNGDGRPEVLSVQSVGESGRILYVVTWGNAGYDLLRPFGGHFDGYDAFGETGFGLEDNDGDGVMEIMGAYGPSASRIDTYRWNGQRYVYQATDDYAR